MTRFSATWALVAFALAIPAGLWYLTMLPEQAHGLVMGKSPTITALRPLVVGGTAVLLVIMLGAGIIRPALNLKSVAGLAMAASLVVMGGFEWTREAARRPYVINEVMYSNGIMKKDVAEINDKGFLRTALWVESKEPVGDGQQGAGRELFIQQCYACHTVGGKNNDIVALTAKMSYRALVTYLSKIHEIRYFMPPFVGTEEERRALAAYIAAGLHGKEVLAAEPPTSGGDKGKALFEEHCSSCHESVAVVGGVFAGKEKNEIVRLLGTLNEISDEMQPFGGTAEEREQLADYLGDSHDSQQKGDE
jgi:mono/diheme cytochrome c family protein